MELRRGSPRHQRTARVPGEESINLRAGDNRPKPTLTFGAEQSLVRHFLGSDPTV
jgi:hypothetical protein